MKYSLFKEFKNDLKPEKSINLIHYIYFSCFYFLSSAFYFFIYLVVLLNPWYYIWTLEKQNNFKFRMILYFFK